MEKEAGGISTAEVGELACENKESDEADDDNNSKTPVVIDETPTEPLACPQLPKGFNYLLYHLM